MHLLIGSIEERRGTIRMVTTLLFTLAFVPDIAGSQSNEIELLTQATILKLGYVGLVSHVSQEELALAAILKHPGARPQLIEMIRNAKTNEAKLYALCGLRNQSRASFLSELRKVRWDGETFNRMQADVVVKARIQEQVENMRSEGCALQQAN